MSEQDRTPLPPRGEYDILDRTRRILADLHPAERGVGQIVLSEPKWVVENSIKALAQRADVSEPTVMRLARKLGCAGFSELKRKLAQDLVITRLFENPVATQGDGTSPSLVEATCDSAIQALRNAAAALDLDALRLAVEAIVSARMIYCFGVGGSSGILAAEAENRFFRLRRPVQATTDPYRQRMTAAIVGEGDVILCFSVTGKPHSVVDAARLARSNGATVISVTAEESDLAEASDCVLGIAFYDDEQFFNIPSSTRYAQLFILDSLAAQCATALAGSTEALKEIRHTLAALHGPIRNQPIGD